MGNPTKVVNPPTWSNGTVLGPTWAQQIQDGVNSSFCSATNLRGWRDEFMYRIAAAQTSTGIFCNTWNVSTLTNGSVNIVASPGVIGSTASSHPGVLVIANTGNLALNCAMLGPPSNLYSSQDFLIMWLVQVVTQASLDTITNGGLVLDFANFGFCAGSDGAGKWFTQDFGGTRATTTAAITNGTWHLLEVSRIAGACTWKVDGATVKTTSSDTNSSNSIQFDIGVKTTAVTSANQVYVDSLGIDFPVASAL